MHISRRKQTGSTATFMKLLAAGVTVKLARAVRSQVFVGWPTDNCVKNY